MQYYAVWNDIYGSRINADVLVSGDSKAWQQVSPLILDTTLHVNSYNIGIDGWYLPMQYARLKIYLKHNKKPDYLIQNVDLYSFYDRDDLFNSEQFLPYLDDTIIKNVTARYIGKFTFPEYYFPLFKYNNHLHLVKEGLFCYLNVGKRASNKLYKGFSGITTGWNKDVEQLERNNPNGLTRDVKSDLLLLFDDYLAFCRSKAIKVIFVFQPVLCEELPYEKNAAEIMNILKQYAAKYDIPYMDYSNDSLGYDRKYFVDYAHLNARGAELFSLEFARDLKNLIKPVVR